MMPLETNPSLPPAAAQPTAQASEAPPRRLGGWLILTAWSVGSAAALTGLSFWTLANMWRKRRVARTLALVFFASNLVVGVANYVLRAVEAEPGAGPPDMTRVVLATVIAIA